MAYASKQGRTQINSRSPRASGQCDRCGFLYNFDHLRWQMDYSGAGIYNKRILVCEKCYDTPQQQLKVIVIPPDPMPIINARPPDYINESTNYRVTSGQNTVDFWTGIPIENGDTRITQNYNTRVTQQTGLSNGNLNIEPGKCLIIPGNDTSGLPNVSDSVPETGFLSDPLVSYVVWNNNSGNPQTWQNDQNQVCTWMPDPFERINPNTDDEILSENRKYALVLEGGFWYLLQEPDLT